jgi:hypothetical protein
LLGGGGDRFLIEAKKTLLNFFSFGGRLFIGKVKKILVKFFFPPLFWGKVVFSQKAKRILKNYFSLSFKGA